MRIGELARRSGLSVSRIRFYEARGVLPETPREANGYRSYGPDALVILNFVDRAQQLGFSLTEIRTSMTGLKAAVPSSATIVAALHTKRDEVDKLIEVATRKKDAIAALLDELRCVT
jgi:DNA-binding transcriptional MerR regulator